MILMEYIPSGWRRILERGCLERGAGSALLSPETRLPLDYGLSPGARTTGSGRRA